MSRLGYYVLLFNARGVGGSSGWASWTAFQEGKDLEELVGHVVNMLGPVEDVALIVRMQHCYGARPVLKHARRDIRMDACPPHYTPVLHHLYEPRIYLFRTRLTYEAG